jgi:hypothetical protein
MGYFLEPGGLGPTRHLRLFQEIEALVSRYGHDRITVFVNDLTPEIALYTRHQLESFVAQRGWKEFRVRDLPGDLTRLRRPPFTHTAHYGNPEPMRLHLRLKRLQELANFSKEGLVITTSRQDLIQLAQVRGVHNIERLGPGKVYIYPSGRISPDPTVLYRIRNLRTASPNWRKFLYVLARARRLGR